VTVGDGVQIGGQAGAADNIEIVAGTRVVGQTGVTGSIKHAGTYLGTPPVPIREYFQMHALLRRLLEREKRSKAGRAHARGTGDHP
jgi:UDP-3-O-[3-hydroxymyristoyl] glucosamine N-acyltransferase